MIATGTVIKDRYSVVNLVGAGSFAEVYLARDRQTDAGVALKFFKQTIKNSMDQYSTFVNECGQLEKIDHRGVLRIFELNFSENTPFMVQEYLEGGDLATLMRDRFRPGGKGFTLEEVLTLGMNVTEALRETHSRGIYHLDLKPSNIMFRNRGSLETVLVDFGNSRFTVNDYRRDQSALGKHPAMTFQYMAPERAGYLKIHKPACLDLYSLGVTLYQLISRELPIKGSSLSEIVKNLYRTLPESLTEKNGTVPRYVDEVILKLLRKSPRDRYQTAKGAHEDLKTCLGLVRGGKTNEVFALGRGDSVRDLNYNIRMVGRGREINQLRKVIEQAQGNQGTVRFIAAPSGTGKSRLAIEALQIAAVKGLGILESKFSRFEQNVPLSAPNRMLNQHAKTLRTVSPEVLARWQERLLSTLGKNGSLLTPRLQFYEGLLPAFPPIEKMPKDTEEPLFLETFARFLTMLELNEDKANVIFLDDLQWADKTSIDLLQHVVLLAREQGLRRTLVIGAFRSEEVGETSPLSIQVLDYVGREEYLLLSALSEKETGELVEKLLDEQGEEVDRLKEYVYRLTEGIPFFVYEVLKASIATGLYYRNPDFEWVFNEELGQSSDLVLGVDNLVVKRIEGLSPVSLELLKTAAVAGTMVSHENLVALIDRTPERFEEEGREPMSADSILRVSTDELMRNHLIVDEPGVLRFFHDRIRDAALKLTRVEEKKEIHLLYGEILSRAILDSEEVEAKDIFEAAFHVMNGRPASCADISKRILVLATQRAMLIFNFRKARDYISTASELVPAGPDALTEQSAVDEWVTVHELYGDALALSESLKEAIREYESVVGLVNDSFHRARIYAKLCDNYLFLFDYTHSIGAGLKGLRELKEPWITSRLVAWISIVPSLLQLGVRALISKTLGRKKAAITTEIDRARWDIRCAVQVPYYFEDPIVTFVNLITSTGRLLRYRTSDYHYVYLMYWAIVLSGLGLRRFPRSLYKKAYTYFNINKQQVRKAFCLFTEAAVCDLPDVRLDEAKRALEEVHALTSGIGESFWRILSLLLLAQYHCFGKGIGQIQSVLDELLAFQRKIGVEATVVASAARHTLMQGDLNKYREIFAHVMESTERQIKVGSKSIDCLYGLMWPAEACIFEEDYRKAIRLLKPAVKISLIRLHRAAACTYPPALLAQAYVRSGSPLKALPSILIAWGNVLLGLKLYYPQTLCTTGEILSRLGLKNRGIRLIRRALDRASQEGMLLVSQELKITLTDHILRTNPEEAEALLSRAYKFYKSQNYAFMMNAVKNRLDKARRLLSQRYPSLYTGTFAEPTDTVTRTSSGLRESVDSAALIEMFRKLSVLADIDTLLHTVLETLCTCTGADRAVVFLPEEEKWVPRAAIGYDMEQLSEGEFRKQGVDIDYFDGAVSYGLDAPKVRGAGNHSLRRKQFRGAAMVVPLVYKKMSLGMVYLANDHIAELFEDVSLPYVSEVATQAAIALSNFSLLASHEEKVRVETELATAKAYNEKLKEANEKIDRLARCDALTGLSNRRDMLERLEQEVSRMRRNGKPLSIIMGDVDHFKQFNDTHGHDCGDFVLIEVSKQIRETLRRQDLVARWGGEEFMIALPETPLEGAGLVAEKIRARLARTTCVHKGTALSITMTFGVARYDSDSGSMDSCIEQADRALYDGKRKGRNRVVVSREGEP